MRQNRKVLTVALYGAAVLLLLLSSVLYLNGKSRVSDVTVSYNNQTRPITLPYLKGSENRVRTFQIAMHVSHGRFGSGRFHVVPDDCLDALSVNGRSVDLSGIPRGRMCDYNNGFEIDLGGYLHPGENEVLSVLQDHSGKRGFDLRPVISEPIALFFKFSLIFLAMLASLHIMQRLQFPRVITLLFGVGMAVRILYLYDTAWDQRSFDVVGHLRYIIYIAEHGWIPEPDFCWTCYHPPLYYMLAAAVYKIGILMFSKEIVLKLLQAFSLVISSGFLIFMLLILKNFVKMRAALIASSALLIFLPSMVIHSVRIGNDVLLYFTYAGALFFYLKWLQTGRGLVMSTLFAAAAVFAKSNGVVILGVLGLSFLLRTVLAKDWRGQFRTIAVMALIYGAIVVTAVGIHKIRSDKGVVGNAQSLNHALFVPNTAVNYLYFDPRIALTEPFADAWHNGVGREYFWNYFMQTALFAQMMHPDHLRSLGQSMSFLFLSLVLAATAALLFLRREELAEYAPFLLNGILMAAAAVYIRVLIPASSSNDFRYSMPLLISLAVFFAYFLTRVRAKGWVVLEWGGYAVSALLVLMSLLFILQL